MQKDVINSIQKLKDKANGLSVLYVEDEESLRKKTFDLLKKIFEDVEVAEDGEEGLNKYNKKKHDIVITDILMPKMDGLTMIKNITKNNKDQKIIVYSAYTEQIFLDEATKYGVKNYMYKPVEINRFIDVLCDTTNNLK